MSTYNSFAPYYDLVMGDRITEANLLRNLLKQHAPNAKSLLELGCGSGSLINVLRKSYACVGIDLSPGMVRLAKKKVPKTRFLEGDITSFDLREKFDVAICAFDTINHILSFSKWKQLFDRAHSHLSPGGVFIFDMNTKHKLERFVTEPPIAESGRGVISIVGGSRQGATRYQIEVKALKHEKGNKYSLHEIRVPEVTFSIERVKGTLKRYFNQVLLFDPDRSRPSSKTEELYFICKLPRTKK